MPGAKWCPIPASTTPMAAHDIVCVHTMVMSLVDCEAYFRRIAPGVNAHYGTGHDGEIRQWVDTRFRSGANYSGNHRVISIENADRGPGFPAWNPADASQVPAFTDAQAEAIAEILAWECSPAAHRDCPPTWACHREGIPLALIPDARPGRRGVGYHRQGVPGYMVAGAEQWSTARGKVCPGDRRIAQIPLIIARARQIASGAPTPVLDPRGPDEMRLLHVNEKGHAYHDRIYAVTALEVTWVTDPAISAALQQEWGEAESCSARHIDLLNFDAEARRWRNRREIVTDLVAQVTGIDVDEEALGRVVVEGMLPKLTAELAAKTGATREDVEQIVRGFFSAAAAAK